MDNLIKAKQEIKDLFGFDDHLADVNDAVIELDAKKLITYRLTVDKNATPREWMEAENAISKYEGYIKLTEILKGE